MVRKPNTGIDQFKRSDGAQERKVGQRLRGKKNANEVVSAKHQFTAFPF